MRPGLRVGQTAEIEIEVGSDMLAIFPDGKVHSLYSSSSLVQHMEWAARKTILPYLEPNEEGIGSSVDLSHVMMTLPGMKVKIKATICDIRGNKIICEVIAFNKRGRIGRGSVTQSIIERNWLERKIREMSVINNIDGSPVK